MGQWILTRLLWLMIGLLVGHVASALAQQDGACATWIATAFSREQFPGTMRSGVSTAGQAGTAVAVGVDGNNRPLIPLGTTVWIEGLGQRQVLDTGLGGGGWLDVLFDRTADAVAWGRRSVTVCR